MRSPGKRLTIYCMQIVKVWCNLGLLYAGKAEGGREIPCFQMQINARRVLCMNFEFGSHYGTFADLTSQALSLQ
jgi:hypothetical protein